MQGNGAVWGAALHLAATSASSGLETLLTMMFETLSPPEASAAGSTRLAQITGLG
jgi:hypothetical protein